MIFDERLPGLLAVTLESGALYLVSTSAISRRSDPSGAPRQCIIEQVYTPPPASTNADVAHASSLGAIKGFIVSGESCGLSLYNTSRSTRTELIAEHVTRYDYSTKGCDNTARDNNTDVVINRGLSIHLLKQSPPAPKSSGGILGVMGSVVKLAAPVRKDTSLQNLLVSFNSFTPPLSPSDVSGERQKAKNENGITDLIHRIMGGGKVHHSITTKPSTNTNNNDTTTISHPTNIAYTPNLFKGGVIILYKPSLTYENNNSQHNKSTLYDKLMSGDNMRLVAIFIVGCYFLFYRGKKKGNYTNTSYKTSSNNSMPQRKGQGPSFTATARMKR